MGRGKGGGTLGGERGSEDSHGIERYGVLRGME